MYLEAREKASSLPLKREFNRFMWKLIDKRDPRVPVLYLNGQPLKYVDYCDFTIDINEPINIVSNIEPGDAVTITVDSNEDN